MERPIARSQSGTKERGSAVSVTLTVSPARQSIQCEVAGRALICNSMPVELAAQFSRARARWAASTTLVRLARGSVAS